MRYHLTLVRMAIIRKSTNNKCYKITNASEGVGNYTVGGNINWCNLYGKH